MRAQRIPTVLNRKEVEWLIAIAEHDIETSETEHERFNATRNVAILRLAFSTGLRIGEIYNLNVDSIFPEEQRLKIVDGKFGNNDYQAIRKKETWGALEKYLPLRDTVEGKGPALFISFHGQRIQDRQFSRDLKRYALRASITKNVHPHCLRHSFLSEFYRVTKDIVATQKVARHKDISSTMIYTHIYDQDIVDGLVQANL